MNQPIPVRVKPVGMYEGLIADARKAGAAMAINLGPNAKNINALSQPLGRITGQADEFTKSMGAANARVLAFGASVGVIGAVSASFAALVKNTIKVESSLTQINSILNKSKGDITAFGQDLFKIAKETGQSFDEVSTAALELARQGLGPVETLNRLKDAMILTRLSGLEAESSVAGLTSAINAFKDSGLSSAQILNKLVSVAQAYAVSEKDLIEGFKRSSAAANQAGVSFDELAGLITAIQEKTARGGAVIGNSLKTIFARIQKKDTLNALEEVGIKVSDLEGKLLPATKILENIAQKFGSFSQIRQADLAQKLGGVYQLSNLLAAVKDLSSAQSVALDATKRSQKASDEAYKKNILYNQTLEALLNKTILSAQELGSTLGEIGFSQGAKDIVDKINSGVEGLIKLLNDDGPLGTALKSFAKGIGSVLSGPGLALFGAIVAKLSKDLVVFGLESLKTFFQFGQRAKEIDNIEKSIAGTLLSNQKLRQQILAIENSSASIEEKRYKQTLIFTSALSEQLSIMNKIRDIAQFVAPSLQPMSHAGMEPSKKGASTAAEGFIPAIKEERNNIAKGVGGARAGDKPVHIPNFNFGGGQKGPIVAHTGEYIVPNYNGSGGSAIFNRDMVRSMGLPKGAKKIGAAGGFIPSFASGLSLATIIKKPRSAFFKPDGTPVTDKVIEILSGPDSPEKTALLEKMNSSSGVRRDLKSLIKPATQAYQEPKFKSEKGVGVAGTITEAIATGKIQSKEDVERFRNQDGRSYDLSFIGLASNTPASQVADVLNRSFSKQNLTEISEGKKLRKNFLDEYIIDANELGGITVLSPSYGGARPIKNPKTKVGKIPALLNLKWPDGTKIFDKQLEARTTNEPVVLSNVTGVGIQKKLDTTGFSRQVNQTFAPAIVSLAESLYGRLFNIGDYKDFSAKLANFKASSAGGILPAGAEGSIFEAASKVALNAMDKMESVFDPKDENRPFDLQNGDIIKKVLGVRANRGDAKRSPTGEQINSLVKKTINDPVYGPAAIEKIVQQRASSPNRKLAQEYTIKKREEEAAKKAAAAATKTPTAGGGFIPNFAITRGMLRDFIKLNLETNFNGPADIGSKTKIFRGVSGKSKRWDQWKGLDKGSFPWNRWRTKSKRDLVFSPKQTKIKSFDYFNNTKLNAIFEDHITGNQHLPFVSGSYDKSAAERFAVRSSPEQGGGAGVLANKLVKNSRILNNDSIKQFIKKYGEKNLKEIIAYYSNWGGNNKKGIAFDIASWAKRKRGYEGYAREEKEIALLSSGFIPNFARGNKERLNAGISFEDRVFKFLGLPNPAGRRLDFPEKALKTVPINRKKQLGIQGSYGDLKLSDSDTNQNSILGKLVAHLNLSKKIQAALDSGRKVGAIDLNRIAPQIGSASMFFAGDPAFYQQQVVSATLGQILDASRFGDEQTKNNSLLSSFNFARTNPKNPKSISLKEQYHRKYVKAKIFMDGILDPKNLPDEPFGKGFIPNFVLKSSLIGEGEYGKFHRLNKEIGVKRFKKTKEDGYRLNYEKGITEEYAVSKLLAASNLVKGVTGPKIFGTLEESLRRRGIRKKIISDPLAYNALGLSESYNMGDVIAELLADRGLQISDLHGKNYTINSAGARFFKEDNYPMMVGEQERTPTKNTYWINDFASKGGVATIIDAGFARVTNPALQSKIREYTEPSSVERAAFGFVPNFAPNPFLKQWNSEQIEWIKKEAVKRKLKIGKDGLPQDISQFQKLAKEYAQKHQQLKLKFADGFVPNFSIFQAFPQKEERKRFVEQAKKGNQKVLEVMQKAGISLKASRFGGAPDMRKLKKFFELKDFERPFNEMFNNAYRAADQKYRTGATEEQMLQEFWRMYGKDPLVAKEMALTKSSGYIPNFAALQDAIKREQAAGVPKTAIYIDSSPRLKSSKNPMGIMVANTIDEPMGGHQGISRAIKEGRDPKTYGMANGFIPNYAVEGAPADASMMQGMKRSEALAKAESLAADELTKLTKKYAALISEAAKQETALEQLTATIDSLEKQQADLKKSGKDLSKKQRKSLAEATQKREEIGKDFRSPLRLTEEREEAKKEVERQKRSRIEQVREASSGILGSGRTITNREARVDFGQSSRDMLGKIFALQSAFSFLTGAVSEMGGVAGAVTQGLANLASNISTAAFAAQGLSGFGGVVGKVAGKLGAVGIAATAVYGIYSGIKDVMLAHKNASGLAAENTAKLAQAAATAAVKLESFDELSQTKINKQAENIFYNLEKGRYAASTEESRANSRRGPGAPRILPLANQGKITSRFVGGDYTGGYGIDIDFEVDEKDKENLKKAIANALAAGYSEAPIVDLIFEQARKSKRGAGGAVNIEPEEMQKLLDEVNDLSSNPKTLSLLTDLQGIGKEGYSPLLKSLNTQIPPKKGEEGSQSKSFFEKLQTDGLEAEETEALIKYIRAELNISELAAKSLLATATQRIAEAKAEKQAASREFVSTTPAKIAEIQIKSSIELAKINQSISSEVDKQIQQAQILGGLSEGALETLTSRSELEKLQLDYASKIRESFAGQVDELKTIGVAESQLENVRKSIANASAMDLINAEKRLKLIQDFNSLAIDANAVGAAGYEQQKAATDELVKQYEASRRVLEIKQQETSKLQARVLKNIAAQKTFEITQQAIGKKNEFDTQRVQQELNIARIQQVPALDQPSQRRQAREIAEEQFKADNLIIQSSIAEMEESFNKMTVELAKVFQGGKDLPEALKTAIKFQTYSPEELKDKEPELIKALKAAAEAYEEQKGIEARLANLSAELQFIRKDSSLSVEDRALRIQAVNQNIAELEERGLDKDQKDSLQNAIELLTQLISKAANIPLDAEAARIKRATSFASDAIAKFGNLIADLNHGLAAEAEQLKFSLLSATEGLSLLDIAQQSRLNSSLQAAKNDPQAISAAYSDDKRKSDARRLRLSSSAEEREAIKYEIAINEKILALREQINQKGEISAEIEQQILDLEYKRIEANKSLGDKFRMSFSYDAEDGINKMNDALVSGATAFRDTLIDGLSQAIEQGGSLGDVLRNAGLEFARSLTKAGMTNLFNAATQGLFNVGKVGTYAFGGEVIGGSGIKDDVPAILMGGEYVLNKNAVKKYGLPFLESLNKGTASGFASGGSVRKNPYQGNFYTPGTYGTGEIEGRPNLLSFASQAYTSGALDQIDIGSNYASINLEPESAYLTNFGRRNGPAAETTRRAKEQAFDLYVQDYKAEKELEKQIKEQEKAQKEALKRQLIIGIASMAAGAAAGAAGSGFSSGWKSVSQDPSAGFGSKLLGGLKGIGVGGDIGGTGVNTGGLKNLFTSIGKFGSGDFLGGSNYYKLSQIGSATQLGALSSDKAFAEFFGNMADVSRAKNASIIDEFGSSSLIKAASTSSSLTKAFNSIEPALPRSSNLPSSSSILLDGFFLDPADMYEHLRNSGLGHWSSDLLSRSRLSQQRLMNIGGKSLFKSLKNATGGLIPESMAIDSIPAMLSGGEFIMNRAASQNIGQSNLQALNSGSKSIVTEDQAEEMNDALIRKLDELIEVSGSAGSINITVNSTTGEARTDTSGNSSTSQAQLAQKIKDVVLKVIQDEKRLGGQLRGGGFGR